MSTKVTMVMYHYVREIKNSRYPDIKGLEYKLFEEQIDFLRKNFQIIRVEDILENLKQPKYVLPENACLLTFDDGYTDHYEYVYPLLHKYGLQGSFYVPAKILAEDAVLDVNKIHFILASGMPVDQIIKKLFDRLDIYRSRGILLESNEALFSRLAVANRFDSKEVIFIKRLLQNGLPENIRNEMTSALFAECMQKSEQEFSRELYIRMEQMEEMKKDGMFFGIHSYSHYWLGKMQAEEMRADIDKSLEALKPVIDINSWVMNYPYGSEGAYNEEVLSYIQEKGCKMGLVTDARVADLAKDNPYLLPRFDTNDFPPKSENYLNLQ